MVLTWKSKILNITLIQHPQLELYHLKAQTLKHVEIIKVSDKPKYDTSLEGSWYVTFRKTLTEKFTIKEHQTWYVPLKFFKTFCNIFCIVEKVMKNGFHR